MSFSNILTGDLTVQVPASYLNLIDIKNHLTNDELLLTMSNFREAKKCCGIA